MRPYSLDTFAMCHADLVHESKIEGGLTGCAMTNKMELWNGDMKGIESSEIEWWNRWISREVVLEVFPPLAGDIVGNDNVGDPRLNTIRKGRCCSIVSVDVPEFRNQLNRINKNKCITFPPSGGQQPHSEGQMRGGRRLRQHLWRCTPVDSLCMLG